MGGETPAPTPNAPEQSASVTPGDAEPGITPEQELREAMTYDTESQQIVDPEYYDILAAQGGIDLQDEKRLIDTDYAATVIQGKLNNITMATETGNEDAILATFYQTAPGEFGPAQEDVDIIREQAGLKQDFQEQYASYPISSLTLGGLKEVVPYTDNHDKVDVTFMVTRVDYGNYTEGQEPVRFASLEEWSVPLHLNDVAGWSDGGTRKDWSFDDIVINSIETIE
jgi:hypothetical protein